MWVVEILLLIVLIRFVLLLCGIIFGNGGFMILGCLLVLVWILDGLIFDVVSCIRILLGLGVGVGRFFMVKMLFVGLNWL